MIAEVSRGLGDCMPGLDVRSMTGEQRLAHRGWQSVAAAVDCVRPRLMRCLPSLTDRSARRSQSFNNVAENYKNEKNVKRTPR